MNMLIRRALAVTFSLSACTSFAASSGTGSFFKLVGAAGMRSQGSQVEQTSDGGYIMIGSSSTTTNATLVVKLDATGRIKWQNTYSFAYGPYLESIRQTPSGYVAAVLMGGVPEVIGVFALDASGKTLWQNTYTTQANDGLSYLNIEPSADGGYMLGGSAPELYTNQYGPAWAAKLDASGKILWEQAFDFDVGSIHPTADSGAVITGYDLCPWACTGTGYVVKMNADGGIGWEKQYQHGVGGLYLTSGRPTSDGGYVVAGSYYVGSTLQGLLMKLAGDGTISWQQDYGSSTCGDISALDAQAAAGGGYTVSWSSCSAAPNAMSRLDSSGAVLWQEGYTEAASTTPLTAAGWSATSDGGLIATGYIGGGRLHLAHASLIKLDGQGSAPGGCTKLKMSSPGLTLVSSTTVTASDADVGSTVTATAMSPASITTTAVQLKQTNGCL